MATTVNLRKVLDRKQWEMCAAPNFAYQFSLVQSTLADQCQYWISATFRMWMYDPREDSVMDLGAIGSGLNTVSQYYNLGLTFHPSGPTGTASAGSSTTLTTTATIPGSLAGYTVRITGGTGAGQERTIASNTYGANAVLTVSSAWTVTPDATSVYLLLTGRVWVLNGSASPALRYYDVATNAWSTAPATTGLSTSSVTWWLAATPAYGNTTATGTATAGAATTLTNSGKSWATNQWANYQLRITAGTGAGQVRTVASNTGTVLTVSSSWTTNPDATSVYALEPNDDYLYAVNTSTTAFYRYSISGNTWSTLSPGNARTGTISNQGNLMFITTASDTTWADETNIKNGRYLYCFTGNNTGNISYYDIAANTWVNLSTYGHYLSGAIDGSQNQATTSICADREFVYILTTSNSALNSGGLGFRYNCVTQQLDPWTTWPYAAAGSGGPSVISSTALRSSVVTYTDGGTSLRWLYFMPFYNPTAVYRMLII